MGGPDRSGFYEMARLEVSVDAQLSSGHVQGPDRVVNSLTNEEARAFLKGLRALVESFDATHEEEAVAPHR